MTTSPPGAGPFRRSLVATLAVLAVLVAIFGTLTHFQGPKIADAQLDTEAVVARNGQQLRIFTNQPVAPILPEQVTIVPDAPFSLSSDGSAIALQFSQPLRYGTQYRVEVAGVTSPSTSQTSTLAYEFTTGSRPVHYLDRGDGTDEIVRTTIAGTERDVIYSAPRIQDFAVFDEAIAVVTIDDDGLSLLSLVSPDGKAEVIPLPAPGTIDLLAAESTSGYLGFVFSDTLPALEKDFDRALFTVDLGGRRQLEPMVGLSGEPLAVLDWTFLPGSTNLIVNNLDQSVLLIDAALPANIFPLGQYSTIDGVSADGRLLAVTDPFGALALDIDSRETERLNPSLLEGHQPYGGPLELLHDYSRVQQVAIFDEESGRFSSHVVFDDGSSSRQLFRTVRDEGGIEALTLSPNEQFVAVELVPNVATSVPDGYEVNPRSTSITTVIIDVESGAIVRSVEGFGLSW